MTPDLVKLSEYKSYAGISSTNQDTQISILIEKVSHLVKSICRRTFVDYLDDAKIEVFRTSTNNRLMSQYGTINKVNAFKVSYTAGYEVIPEDLKLAVFDLIGYYARNDAAIHSHKAIGANTVQIEYVTNTALPAHIRRVLDLHSANYL